MTPDDVRLTAQLVVDKRVHCVTDESVMALARRVLELESDAEEHAANVRHVEREACAKVADAEAAHWFDVQSIAKGNVDQSMAESFDGKRRAVAAVAAAIRARGAK